MKTKRLLLAIAVLALAGFLSPGPASAHSSFYLSFGNPGCGYYVAPGYYPGYYYSPPPAVVFGFTNGWYPFGGRPYGHHYDGHQHNGDHRDWGHGGRVVGYRWWPRR